ncbi:MAG: LuxR C-terminal-related transcriptional regulator [Desulfopila sp.]|jgi:DNA-binding CsgD family transcriptional regulator|nr:LuxR C-terminal-related transcriptional regulator [Desulfopila sp.]
MADADIYHVVVNSLSAHVAILDENGVILETNEAWQNYARANGMKKGWDSVGVNYLSICRAGAEDTVHDAEIVARGIEKVVRGELKEFFHQYPCHSPTEKRWYIIRVVPYRDEDVHRVIITHEDITPIMIVQEELEFKEAELLRQRERLEETNIALKVLLRQRDEDRTRIEETMYTNVDRLVLPYVERLLQGKLTEKQRTLAEVVEENLREITAPFLRSLAGLKAMLTPQEIEVANMVRGGRSSKEIAEVLNLSVSGVDFHRKSLRRKLGLTNSPQNLRSYLMSLE